MSRDSGPRHVVLVGLMGSGKSVVGEMVACRLGRAFVDNDQSLTSFTGHTARELSEAKGQAELHRLERLVLERSLQRTEPAVIAAAASIADRQSIADLLAPHVVVWLTAEPATLAARAGTGSHRPLADVDVEHLLARQAAERGPRYAQLAAVTVVTDDLDPSGVADQVVDDLIGGEHCAVVCGQ